LALAIGFTIMAGLVVDFEELEERKASRAGEVELFFDFIVHGFFWVLKPFNY